MDGRTLGPSKYREVRYEDLLEHPEQVLTQLCHFLRLSFDEAMLRYHDRADAIIAGVRSPDSHGHLGLPLTKGLRDWRTQMDRGDLARIEARVGGLLTELEYERAFPRIPLRARFEMKARVWARHARRVTRDSVGLSASTPS
jgi:hypothetical protein